MLKIKRVSLFEKMNESEVDWYVIFNDIDSVDGLYWWTRWLKKGFKHCYAVRWDGFNWIAFAPYMGFTDVKILNAGENHTISDICPDSVILHINEKRKIKRIRTALALFTCVEQIKALLGIRAFVFTPYQLYEHLRGKHGKSI